MASGLPRDYGADDPSIKWLVSAVKFALDTDSLSEAIQDPEASRPAKNRLCNEDGALFVLSKFFAAAPGSAIFFSKQGPLNRVVFTVVDHDDDKSTVLMPPTPYAFAIKTCDPTTGATDCLQ